MRLTHLKLAGFKSFVDPTTIHLHGQRVGVVGPNGCGKSNVMESVRWVLGESSAREMRADAMDAVIFNGSGNRKPISRASVELVFDNSLGGASGEWNQYAEISVKRVIERDKGSTYYINNTAVRRRDVADLFLGTGLGGRAYAIIGQNTISRIVEARPEELRVFLEEAAGISKYKERRRETELRLRDTRENLERVEDISREMNKQIIKLEAQAVVTQKFHTLQDAHKLAEAQWWWLRKRDAVLAHEAASQTVDQAVNALEAQMASLRDKELQLEQSRQHHQEASSQLHTAQAAFYEANSQVSNLGLQVKQSEEARDRLLQEQLQLQRQMEHRAQQHSQLQTQLADKTAALTIAESSVAQHALNLQSLQQGLPEQSTQLQIIQQAANQAQQAVQQSRQQMQLEQNNVNFIQRNLTEAGQRLQQLHYELERWALPDTQSLGQLQLQLIEQQDALQREEQQLADLRAMEHTQQQTLQQSRNSWQQAQRALHQLEAEIQSLQKLQQSMKQDQQLGPWLQKTGLQSAPRLWQVVQVDSEWQTALEAFLGNKLNALLPETILEWSQLPHPQAAIAIVHAGSASSSTEQWQGLPSLYSLLTIKQPQVAAALQHWLAGVYVLADAQQLSSYQSLLPDDISLLTKSGDIYQRFSAVFHGRQNQMQGVLERQQQLDNLQAGLKEAQEAVAEAQQKVHTQEVSLQNTRQQQQQSHQSIKQLTTSLHDAQMQVSRLQQAHDNAMRRQTVLKEDITQAESRQADLAAEIAQAHANISGHQAQFANLEQTARETQAQKQQAEQAYYNLRDTVQQAEKAHQSQVFEQTLLKNAVNDLQQRLTQNEQESQNLQHHLAETEQALAISNMETLKANLAHALTQQHDCEQALAQARNQLAEQENALQTQERNRMLVEQQLHPLRDAVEQRRLKQQECRLQVEQCQSALAETGLDEALIQNGLDTDSKVHVLAQTTQKLQQQIQQLGPVNMAAIEELSVEKERKGYLDSQLKDLLTASETLEEAIQKIDRETRGKLRATFEEANRNFGELFQTLFNGGQAKLELLGDEILDTGVQVFAQPPGKKNTTIQLLSGGEKALTAMALVFALFRLNPAPFCLMDEVDAPLDDSNTERFCQLVRVMSEKTQFLFVSHNKITMEMSQQLIGVTMQESGVSRIVDVDIDEAIRMHAA
ncbi:MULTISPECIES: chromosome segregation protein SMC [unclassified Methylophilus]|uniref:chromosome segregation protein SMC n=1 Tax=unclassified Methylophilus TaxID=2630143 RepID=UPI0006F32373|nr:MULTISPECIES: chromosome segregation protein SMC [unclassified Methylophilus]KQT43257.1 chromosome segregation protein SMC [Methylophilus sp. Leaf416]KQT58744.1 chromosome segregation protein SMC [Methylophilus sp. Leaf459]